MLQQLQDPEIPAPLGRVLVEQNLWNERFMAETDFHRKAIL